MCELPEAEARRTSKALVAILRSARVEYPSVRMSAIDIASVAVDEDSIYAAVITELQQAGAEAEVSYQAEGRRMVRRYLEVSDEDAPMKLALTNRGS